MRRIKFQSERSTESGWDKAVTSLASYLKSPGKADLHLDSTAAGLSGETDRAQRALFISALRQAHRTRQILSQIARKPPAPLLEAVILTAGAELIENDTAATARIVHHAVERAKSRVSPRETAFLNAILRKLAGRIHTPDPEQEPAIYYSHPEWLVERWFREFGHRQTLRLLQWNQGRANNYIRLDPDVSPDADAFAPTAWVGFHLIRPEAVWEQQVLPLIQSGTAYIKDPSTRFASQLLAPRPGERVLDLCAAPGGKTRDLARMMGDSGKLIAVDLPGPRDVRLRENLIRIAPPRPSIDIVTADVLDLAKRKVPVVSRQDPFDAVLLDAPCSNTGVIQRRTDVKLRLQPQSIDQAVLLQSKLIAAAAGFVRPGGRLVYSTCSIERSENRSLIRRFLRSTEGTDFSLCEAIESFPWESGHDGAGAFLLARSDQGHR